MTTLQPHPANSSTLHVEAPGTLRSGRVEAVSLSSLHDFSKQPQGSIHLLAGLGVEGDAHCGSTTQHLYLKRRNPAQPNLAQVHLFAREMLDELTAAGFAIPPGAMGENILTVGLDLLALPLGTRLHAGPHAVLEVTGLRTPCSQIDRFRPGLQPHCWGPRAPDGKRTRRAGIMAIVHTGGLISPNDTVTVHLPPKPHHPLPPV